MAMHGCMYAYVFVQAVILGYTEAAAPVWATPINSATLNVNESPNSGVSIETLSATGGDGTGLTYSVTSTGPFTVVGTDLQTNGATDHEGTASYSATLSVTDSVNPAVDISVTITIVDVNDAPQFTSAATNVDFETATAPSTSIYTAVASDEDLPANTLTYSLQAGNTNTDFSIDGSSGVVTNLNVLNYETTLSYNLGIRVNDGAIDVDMTLPITVHGPPVFTNPAPAGSSQNVLEHTAAATTLYTLVATDANTADTITYSIDSQSPTDVVTLVGDKLIVAGGVTFNHEGGTTSYAIVVRATDDSVFTLASPTATLTLTITDENDPPVVSPASGTALVVEDQGAQTTIHTIPVTDEDTGDTFTYTITSGNDGGLFQAAFGVVNTLGSLFYNTASTHNLQITISDGTDSVVYSLTVNVDSVPAFTSLITFSLPENTAVSGTEVFAVVAADADGDALVYTFTNDGSVPEFGMPTGSSVTVAAALDFETTTSYTLNFEAEDPQGNTAATVVTVTITDSNDLPPVFSAASYTADALELVATATVIVTVAATDADTATDNNNVIRFSITAGNDAGLFSIDAESGAVSATNLNHATAATHTLTITATDRAGAATGSLTATAPLVVTVKTKPQFTTPASSGLTFTIQEDQATTPAFYTLVAPDADGGTATFTLASQAPTSPAGFTVDGTTGGITLNAALDIDPAGSVTSYTLNLEATDGTYTSTTSLIISIADANDNTPTFSAPSFAVTIQETLSVGSSVSDAAVATDLDATLANNNIQYSITAGNGDAKFVLASSPSPIYQVNVAAALSYASASTYTLTITASDGTLSSTTNLVITIKTLPIWTAPASGANTATIDENSATSASVFQLVAADADSDPVSFTIVTQSTAGQFKIDAPLTGELQVDAATLDYETAPGPFTLTFKAASDGAEVTSVALSVTVNDVNDHAPAFASSNLAKTLKTSAAANTLVYQVTATDGDGTTANNQISSYSIESGDTDSKFSVNSTGYIYVSTALGATATTYTLHVIAVDTGAPAQTGTVTIAVTVVLSTNPVITAPATATTVSIPENSAVGTTVYSVVATDADSDTLVYTIKSVTPGHGSSLFTVDGATGDLKVAVSPDYEATPAQTSFTIQIYVDDDDGNTANKLTTPVITVTVTDVNEYPVFSANRVDVSIMEWQFSAVSVCHQVATNDETSQTLTYAIVAGDPQQDFTIDTSTGQVTTTTQGLSWVQQLYYLLAIQVNDGGTPNRAASYHCLVTVTQFNAAGRVVMSGTLIAIISVLYTII